MSKYKVGETVRIRGVRDVYRRFNGRTGRILETNVSTEIGYSVLIDNVQNGRYFEEPELELVESDSGNDDINNPSHYTAYKGIEVIQLTEQLNFNRGNAVKYIARAGLKNPDTELEDLKKAAWYVNREIARIENA